VAISSLIFLLLATGAIFPFSAQAEDPIAQNPDAHLKALGLDRKYHKCTSVADGDTLTLDGLGTVRFVGVDASEKNHPGLPIQFLSKEAGAFMERLCLGKMIRLDYNFIDKNLRGKYGRLLGFAYLQDGTFLQEALIKNGYATAYTKYPFDEDKKAGFLIWEQQARQKRIGLWKDDGLAEVNWILEQNHPLLQVIPASDGTWKIVFGSLASEVIRAGELEKHLALLYASIYELSPRDLLARLAELQYRQIQESNTSGDDFLILGMSHRKWGILYRKRARPQVPQGELDGELDKLKAMIRRRDSEKLAMALSENRFFRLPGEIPGPDAQLKTALKFLTPDVIVPTNEDIIPWDLAGRYVGKYKTVEGTISRTHNSGKACFLNFHNNWTRYFSLVIFENVFHRFEGHPEDYYLNKRVRASGKIKLYKGRPEMVIDHPHQIKIINGH